MAQQCPTIALATRWGSHSAHRSFLDETGAPIGVQQKLMRHSNVATTMNVYGSASLKARQQANSKVVQMVITLEKPQTEWQSVAV